MTARSLPNLDFKARREGSAVNRYMGSSNVGFRVVDPVSGQNTGCLPRGGPAGVLVARIVL